MNSCVINKLLNKMIQYYSNDPKRIQHFIKVHSFAKLIGEAEKLNANDLFILESAAVVHDIGIKSAEAKYGNCSGKNQEKEGPPEAEKLLEELKYDTDKISQICWLVAHHHTYNNIDGTVYQILVEADFLVNLYEDNCSMDSIRTAYNKIFKTKSGKELCTKIYGI